MPTEPDITTTLWIVAQEGVRELQNAVMWICLASLAALAVVLTLHRFGGLFHRIYRDWLHLDGVGRIGAVAAIALMTMYGGAKHGRPQEAGADEGITLAYIEFEVTNVVVSASVTNTMTTVDVAWTAGTVTTETPVQVRMSQTNEWTVLTKTDASTFLDSPTNHLYFTTAGDRSKYPYWWVGSNPPAIIIEVVGITLTAFHATSHSVAISWTCDDARATEFVVEYRNGNTGSWTEVMRTEELNVMISGFFINRTTQWRVSSTVEGGN